MFEFILNLQLFAAGTLVNATTNYVNADTGATTAFSGDNTLTPGMKTYYDTALLENARNEHYFTQFGKHVPLPAHHSRTIEFRKWNTLPNAPELTEGVIPSGEKMGQTTLTASLKQHGMFVAITDLLDLHYIDPVLQGATEELGASAGETQDILCRNELQTGTNVMFADTVTNGAATTPTDYSGMSATNNRLTAIWSPFVLLGIKGAAIRRKTAPCGSRQPRLSSPRQSWKIRSSTPRAACVRDTGSWCSPQTCSQQCCTGSGGHRPDSCP